MSVVKMTISHQTSVHQYLMEEATAKDLKDLLSKREAVVEVSYAVSNEFERTRFSHWEATAKNEEWLRAAKEQLSVKLVPVDKKDAKQPEESDLMMAIYDLSKARLLKEGKTTAPSVIQHKVLG